MRRVEAYVAFVTAAAVLALAGCAHSTPARLPSSGSAPSSTPSASQSAAASGTPASQPATAPAAAVPAQKPVPPETNPPGDIPDNQAFVPYKTSAGFMVKVPEGWSRTTAGDSVVFTDKLNTIRVQWATAAAPTVANVKSIDVPQLQATEAAFRLKAVKAVKLPAGPAVQTTYQMNGAANAVTGKQYRLDVERYSLSSHGTRVDLTLSSPAGADNVDPWRIVKDSLSWK